VKLQRKQEKITDENMVKTTKDKIRGKTSDEIKG
jgi:hypothetical protein